MNDETEELIRDLLTRFVHHPEALTIERSRNADGGHHYKVRGHQEDNGIIIGRGGSHFKAMQLLVTLFAEHDSYQVDSDSEYMPPRAWAEKQLADYDPEPVCELLGRILDRLPVGEYELAYALPALPPGEKRMCVYSLKFDEADVGYGAKRSYDYMIGQRESEYAKRHGPVTTLDTRSTTVVGSIGTLFRAIGEKDGVKFLIKILRPRTPAPTP